MKYDWKRILVLTAVLAGVCAPLGAADKSAKGAARAMRIEKVTVAPVGESTDTMTRRLAGTVVAIDTYNVVPRVSGDILRQGFSDGGLVKKGQLLFEIEDVRYRAAVAAAEAKVAQIKAQIEYAKGNFDRNDKLFKQQAVSLDTRDNIKSTLNVLEANLQAAEAELALAKDDLSHTKIYALYDGKTGKSALPPGNYITPATGKLVTVTSTTPVRVRFAVSERDLQSFFGTEEKLRANGRISVKLADGTIYPHPGKITIVDNVSVVQNTDSVQVWAQFDNPDYILHPGSAVTVLLRKEDPAKLPAVPRTAVVFNQRGAIVYVVDQDNVAEARPVSLGSINGDLQVIHSGVKKGERVIVEGMHKIFPGSKVDPVTK